jgi:hypothetical protein
LFEQRGIFLPIFARRQIIPAICAIAPLKRMQAKQTRQP